MRQPCLIYLHAIYLVQSTRPFLPDQIDDPSCPLCLQAISLVAHVVLQTSHQRPSDVGSRIKETINSVCSLYMPSLQLPRCHRHRPAPTTRSISPVAPCTYPGLQTPHTRTFNNKEFRPRVRGGGGQKSGGKRCLRCPIGRRRLGSCSTGPFWAGRKRRSTLPTPPACPLCSGAETLQCSKSSAFRSTKEMPQSCLTYLHAISLVA